MINAQLLQMVINASNDGIVIAEKEGEQDNILIYVNPAFERLTGYTSEEILYQDCRFLQSGDRDQEALPLIREALRQWRFLSGNPQELPQGWHTVLERTVAVDGEESERRADLFCRCAEGRQRSGQGAAARGTVGGAIG